MFSYVWTPMQATMLEVYNEEIRDLLGKGPPAGGIYLHHSFRSHCPLFANSQFWCQAGAHMYGWIGSLRSHKASNMAHRLEGRLSGNLGRVRAAWQKSSPLTFWLMSGGLEQAPNRPLCWRTACASHG